MGRAVVRQQKSSISPEVARAFAHLSREQKHAFIAKLTDAEATHLKFMWEAWARDKQLEPGGRWTTWLVMAGRGFGKTRTGAEWVRKKVESGKCGRLALVGRTAADVRDVMIDGESGILAISPPWFRPRHEGSRRRLTWPNGAIATTYSAEEPNSLRGPQHDGFWADEPGAWQYEDAWDQLMFGLRLGEDPRGVATTTPRVTPLIKRLIKQLTTHITKGTTYENQENLAPTFLDQVVKRYEGTRLGRQELEAEMLEDIEGALWQRAMIDGYRVAKIPELIRIVVAIDPAVTAEEGSSETGIIVAGMGEDQHGYILDDKSLTASPNTWANEAIAAYYKYQADRVIGEVNQGGDLIENTLRTIDENVSYKSVHAKHGKWIRAEPISALYERGLIHHVGMFPDLEDQLCNWTPGAKSPDRLDALVWALTELNIQGGDIPFAATSLSVPSSGILSAVYKPQEGEMSGEAEQELERRQAQIAHILQQITGMGR